MLILTRRPSETIYIGEDVTITVLGIVGNQVRFGIEAPKSVVILRAELRERNIRQQGTANGNLAPGYCDCGHKEYETSGHCGEIACDNYAGKYRQVAEESAT